MNQLPSSLNENKPKDKKNNPWVWACATILLCLFFAFAPVSGIFAESRIVDVLVKGQNEDTQGSSRYTSVFQNVFDFIQRNYVDQVDPKALFEGAMTGMFKSLEDPYTSFLTESDMSDLNDTTQGSFGGVGLYIIKPVASKNDSKPPYVEITAPIEDTPGWRAGINPGDLLIEIDGESTDRLTMDEVLARLRGRPGLDVKLLIRRGEKLEFPVTLTRAVIEVPTTKFDMIGDIGYIRLISFTPMTADRARDAVNNFRTKGYKGLILDLRNNYGGLLNSAVDICSLFLSGGLVVSTKSRIESGNEVFYARRSPVVPDDIPVIVLINRGSASASEIVAGALKDRGRAFLVGEKSFGKGSVQQVYPLEKSGFKITTARYYTPSDANIDKIGIPPDREVKLPEFTDADVEKLAALISDNKIPDFVSKNQKASAAQIDNFALTLEKEYQLDLSLLKRMIRNEQNRTVIAPVYDLEYDVQLQDAVNILRSGSYNSLMQTTKTIKELQYEEESDLPLAS